MGNRKLKVVGWGWGNKVGGRCEELNIISVNMLHVHAHFRREWVEYNIEICYWRGKAINSVAAHVKVISEGIIWVGSLFKLGW